MGSHGKNYVATGHFTYPFPSATTISDGSNSVVLMRLSIFTVGGGSSGAPVGYTAQRYPTALSNAIRPIATKAVRPTSSMVSHIVMTLSISFFSSLLIYGGLAGSLPSNIGLELKYFRKDSR